MHVRQVQVFVFVIRKDSEGETRDPSCKIMWVHEKTIQISSTHKKRIRGVVKEPPCVNNTKTSKIRVLLLSGMSDRLTSPTKHTPLMTITFRHGSQKCHGLIVLAIYFERHACGGDDPTECERAGDRIGEYELGHKNNQRHVGNDAHFALLSGLWERLL